jgi:hypothetical protein
MGRRSSFHIHGIELDPLARNQESEIPVGIDEFGASEKIRKALVIWQDESISLYAVIFCDGSEHKTPLTITPRTAGLREAFAARKVMIQALTFRELSVSLGLELVD